MRFWVLLLLTSLTLFAMPTISLYKALKELPPISTLSFAPYNTELLFPDIPLSQEITVYRTKLLLQPQFVDLNPGLNRDYVVDHINVNNAMSSSYRQLTEDTIYTQIALIAAVGVLVVLPESVSKWDVEELQKKSLGERWTEHVTTKPVWDQDEFAINYIGHPVFGAVYYTMARDDGMSIFESAAFSTVMSTFFWEYGYEAFAEIPSVQDLIFTPLIGSFLGEGMHVLEKELDANDGKIWGSRSFGGFAYFWLNPMGNIAHGLGDFFDVSVTMQFTNFPHNEDVSQFRFGHQYSDPVRFTDRDYGVVIILE